MTTQASTPAGEATDGHSDAKVEEAKEEATDGGHTDEKAAELRDGAKEEEWFPSHKYFVAGTWSNFSALPMHWNGSDFVHVVTVGSKGWESFQILQGGQWDKTYYPSAKDANPYLEWKLRGPDSFGNGKNWTIGIPPDKGCDERNVAKTGEHFRITVSIDGQSDVTEVSWKQLTSAEMKEALPRSRLRALGPRRILVLRHGSRPDNAADPPLDLLGFSQAKQAARHLGREAQKIGVAPIMALFCSPFLRAQQTAVPVAQALKLPIRVEEGFCELLAHQWLFSEDPLPCLGLQRDGRPPASLFDQAYKSAVKPFYPDIVGRMAKGDAEGRRRPTKRHRKAIQAALSAARGGSVVVVGHASTHDFLAQALCPMEHLEANHTPHCVDHCSITEILEQDGAWRLAAFGARPAREEPAQQVKPDAEPRQPKPDEEPPPAASEPAAAPAKSIAARLADEDARAKAAAIRALREEGRLAQQAYEDDQPVWVVVGGAGSNGIVARRGVSLHSPELNRLQMGARVVQLDLKRDRLHYRKLEGDGPDFGWVTVKNKDGELVRREADAG